jgi:hypothetical protein
VKSGVRGALLGGVSGLVGGAFFMTLAGIGACGPRMQNWITSMTRAEMLDYLVESAKIGAAFGGIVGIAAAISPAVLGYTNAVIGGIGLGFAAFDMAQNGVNLCNVLGAGLSIAGGLGGGGNFTLRIPKFNILLGPTFYAPGVGAIGGGATIAVTGYVTISVSSTGALLINNIVMMAAAGGGTGSGGGGGGGGQLPKLEKPANAKSPNAANPNDWEANLNGAWPESSLQGNGINWEAAHIVPRTMLRAEATRRLLARFGIHVNSPANQTWLPALADDATRAGQFYSPQPLAHRSSATGLHTHATVDAIINRVTQIGNQNLPAATIQGQLIDLLTTIANSWSQGKTWP